jgi:FHS family L-fucose permease-like MFS transporter
MTGRRARARYLVPLLLIVSLFFLWGVANNLNDVLIKHFKKAFTLSDFQSGLVQSAFYFGYFCFAIPAALFMKRWGYKAAVVLGLALFGTGALLFIPCRQCAELRLFPGALYVIASGLAFLETSANPLMTVLGPPETAERRLTFAQAFNPLGSIAGVLIGSQFILSGIELTAAQQAAMAPDALAAWFPRRAARGERPLSRDRAVRARLGAARRADALPARRRRGGGRAGQCGRLPRAARRPPLSRRRRRAVSSMSARRSGCGAI